MENRDAWAIGPGGIARGANSGVLWSPLLCTKATLHRLIEMDKYLIEEDIQFILLLFRFRDSYIKQFAPNGNDLLSSLYLFSDSWDLSKLLESVQLEDSYRLYIVVRLVNAFALIVLFPSSKTFRIVYAVDSGMADSNRTMFKRFADMLFASNIQEDGILGTDWKEGCISQPHLDWLAPLEYVVPAEPAQAIFVVYVIYYLTVEAPVYFNLNGDDGKTLRENLAYYCLKGNLPY